MAIARGRGSYAGSSVNRAGLYGLVVVAYKKGAYIKNGLIISIRL